MIAYFIRVVLWEVYQCIQNLTKYYEKKSKFIPRPSVGQKEWHEDGNFAENAVFTSHILVKICIYYILL